MPLRLDASAAGFERDFSSFLARNRDTDENVDRIAADIVADVRTRGDAALIDYTEKFDRLKLTPAGLRVSQAEREKAAAKVPAPQREALVFAAKRIEAFHRALLPRDVEFTDSTGTRLGARYRPIDSAGVYVPGGTAAYPSSVLMNVVPAKVAGVKRLVMVVPTPGGHVEPLVLAAAKRSGIDEIYRVGGAQAVAARSYSATENRYANLARTCDSQDCQVYGGAGVRETLNDAFNLLEHPLTDQAIVAVLLAGSFYLMWRASRQDDGRRFSRSESDGLTPRDIVDRLNGEINKLLGGDIRGRLTELGLDAVGGTPEHFAAFIRQDIAKYAKIVKSAGIPPQ